MDKNQNPPRSRRPGSLIWQYLNRGTARFYTALGQSSLGRFMMSYEKMGAKLTGNSRFAGRYRCAPVSPARERLVNAVESATPIRVMNALWGGLMDCPMACYGLFMMLYGLCSILIYFVGPHVSDSYVRVQTDLIMSIAVSVMGFPVALSRRSLADSLGNSSFARGFFIGFLGVPRDRLAGNGRRMAPELRAVLFSVAALLGAGTSVVTLFIPSWVIPLILLVVSLVGTVFAYPETGVVLLSLMLPLVWLNQATMIAVVILVLLTWCSFGLKLLLLHRTMHFGLLDRVMVILNFVILASGFTGRGITLASIWQSVCLSACVSAYFLVVNLVTTRDYVRRCLVGVGISVVVVTTLAYLRQIPVESLMWLEGSRAGDAIIAGSRALMTLLSQLWVDHSELYLVLVFSWLYAYILHTPRPLRKFFGGIFILLDLALIIMTDSVSALLCVVVVTILFLLMLGHKWLSAGLLTLPVVICGGVWVQYLYPISDGLLTALSRSRLYKTQLVESLWRMVWDHPAGIGVGDRAFAAVYPFYAAPDLGGVTDCGNVGFELLLNYGWSGLLIFAVALILFVQKSFSALRHTLVLKDRAMILGGVTSFLGLVLFGTVRSFMTYPRVFFTVTLVVALCSAYENIIFEEAGIEAARRESTAHSEDCLYRHRH